MSIIDIVILLIVVLGAVVGLYKGFIKQLASILGLIAGLFVAKSLYLSLAEKIAPLVETSMTIIQIISFIVIWLCVPLVFTLIASLLSKIIHAISLGWLDHIAGLALGVAKYILIISVIINLLDFIDSDNQLLSKTKKEESVLYYPIKEGVKNFFPATEKTFKKNPPIYKSV